MPALSAITVECAGMRLDRYLRTQFPDLTLSSVQRALRLRQVRINNRRCKGDARLELGDTITVPGYFSLASTSSPASPSVLPVAPRMREKLERMVIADTSDYLVLNKPAGLAVQGGSGTRWHLDRLLPSLAALYGDPPDHLRIVHRLDKETSGLLLVARGRPAAQHLARLFQNRQLRKYYVALCQDVPNPETGLIDAPLGKCPDRLYHPDGHAPRPATTRYHLFDQVSGIAACVLLAPISGRTHQLRAHLALIGCPILGDPLYNPAAETTTPLCLHAIGVTVPGTSGQSAIDYFQTPPAALYSEAQAQGLHIPTLKEFRALLADGAAALET